MGRGDTPNLDESGMLAGAVEPATDDLADIDPAELFDPEEFGIRRQRP